MTDPTAPAGDPTGRSYYEWTEGDADGRHAEILDRMFPVDDRDPILWEGDQA